MYYVCCVFHIAKLASNWQMYFHNADFLCIFFYLYHHYIVFIRCVASNQNLIKSGKLTSVCTGLFCENVEV